jgi:hypothetical protein
VTTEGPGLVTRRMYSGSIGDKILTIRGYCDGRDDQHGLFPGLILFRLMTSPLETGVVRPYSVHNT